MLDVVNGEEIGFLEEDIYRAKAKESLSKGEGLKEGIVARKAQFNLFTRNAERKQWYDERDRVTVEIKDEQDRECVTELKIDDSKDGIYNISYFPRVQGTIKLFVKVNGEHIHGSRFAVILKPFQVKPVLCVGKEGSGEGMLIGPMGVAVTAKDEVVVADNQNHRVQVSNSTFLRSFGRQGKNAGEFGRILQELPLIKIEIFWFQSIITIEYRSLVGRGSTWVHLAAKEALIVSSFILGVYS